MPTTDQTLENLAEFFKMFGTTAAILFGALLVYLVISKLLGRAERGGHLPGPFVATLRRVARGVLLLGTALLILQAYGLLQNVFVALGSLLALVAIGFVAVWSVLSNTLCSLILLIVRPFEVGDRLEFPPDDVSGKAVNFNLIYTTLRTDDGAFVHIPNNMFFQRMLVRKPGRGNVALGEQLYEPTDAEV